MLFVSCSTELEIVNDGEAGEDVEYRALLESELDGMVVCCIMELETVDDGKAVDVE